MKIKAYPLYTHAVGLQSAPPVRQEDRQTVLAAASQRWEFVCPVAFTATWNGGPRAEDIEIRLAGARDDGELSDPAFVQSHVGEGLLTFYPGYQLKTEAGYRLWLRGPLNATKDGLYPLESVVDTALLPCTVTMQWQFTRPHHTIRFEAGEPFAALLLYPQAAPDTGRVEVIGHENDAEAYAQIFQQLTDTPALSALFQRLSATPIESGKDIEATPVTSLPPATFIDTRDGRVDVRQFEPGFFFPERFFGKKMLTTLEQYGEVHPPDLYVIDALKLVYLSIPKAACTAIKLALAKASGIVLGREQDTEFIHLHPQWHLEKGKLTEAQNGYHRFSFVRNPFDRLVSCYRQKIIFTPTPTVKNPFYQKYFFALPPNSSFADFAQRISKIPDALADNHFKSQYALLYSKGELQVDHVGKVEQLAHDWQPLAEHYPLDRALGVVNVSKNKPGSHSDYRLYYTEPLVQIVYARYRQDVEAFGYQAEYEQLLAFVREQTQNARPVVSTVAQQQGKASNLYEA